MRLSDVLGGLSAVHLSGPDPETVEVRAVVTDSRQAGPQRLFAAVPGTRQDGHDFVEAAWAAGSPAVLVSRPVQVDGPCVIQVDDVREAVAECAANLHGRPGERLPLVGVTGTNGKTTVTWLLEAVAIAAGRSPGVLGTTGYRFADEHLAATHTTPAPEVLQSLLGRMRAAGADLAVMEVSSHALDQARVAACRFRVGAFTNLTRDHLDYHPDLEAYFAAKVRLFTDHLHPEGMAVVNVDDAFGRRLRDLLLERGQRVLGTSTAAALGEAPPPPGSEARLTALVARLGLDGTTATFLAPDGSTLELASPLVGAHNLENLATAAGAAWALGLPRAAIARGLAACIGVPGRLERVPDAWPGASPRHLFVDYAHTDDALARVIGTLRRLMPEGARLVTVFGAGGDRDRGKRPLMGRAASASDVVVVTSDNPRHEDPRAIIDGILPGLLPGTDHRVEPDRARAIGVAAALARAGDVILVAGKGHETGQVVGDVVRPFDDRIAAREALAGVSPATRPDGEERSPNT